MGVKLSNISCNESCWARTSVLQAVNPYVAISLPTWVELGTPNVHCVQQRATGLFVTFVENYLRAIFPFVLSGGL